MVNKYYYVRQVIWAFERVRKKIQKKYGKENRLLFKHSKRILTKRSNKLNPEQRERVEYLLYFGNVNKCAVEIYPKFLKLL